MKIRVQKDQRKGLWKLVKKTTTGSGGWARFGTKWFGTKEEAENELDMLCSQTWIEKG